MHTTKPSPKSSLCLIHNGDYSGEVHLAITNPGTGEAMEVTIDGPDFLELCEAVATDIIMAKIEKALER